MRGGLIFENIKPKDYVHESYFGSADKTEEIKPLGRDVSNVLDIYQGDKPTCVSCAITWIRQWFAKEKIDLSHEFLASISKTGETGARPSQVLEPARKTGIATQDAWDSSNTPIDSQLFDSANEFKIGGYTRIIDLSPHGLYSALKKNPIAVGVNDWKGVGKHFMVAYDVDSSGQYLKGKNWWIGETDVLIPVKDIVIAYSFLPPGTEKPVHNIRAGFMVAMKEFVKKNKIISSIISFLTVTMIAFAGYTPVTSFETRTTETLSTSDSTIPVSTVKDRSGAPVDTAYISPSSTVRMFFNIEPGNSSREELVYCTGISGSSFTGCVRGLPFQGGSLTASSTLAKRHPAGSKMIMTNIGQFFTEYVSVSGDQTIYDVKTFYSFPRASSTTALCTEDSQFCSKYYIDNVGAGGMTAVNVSSTMGLVANGTSPETVGIKLSSTSSGMYFNPSTSYSLSINASSTKHLAIDSTGYLYFDDTDDFTWTGSHTFSGTSTFSGDVVGIAEPFFGDGSDGFIDIGSGTSTLNTANKYVYQFTDVSVTGTAELAIGSNLYGSCVTVFVQNDLTLTSSFATSINLFALGATSSNGGLTQTSALTGALGNTFVNASSSYGGAGIATAQKSGGGGGGGAGLGNNGSAGSAGTSSGGAGGLGGLKESYHGSYSINRLISLGHVGAGGAGGGGGSQAGAIGGPGGHGGGCMIFVVGGDITLSGNMSAAGRAGYAGKNDTETAGGGGGGGGGGFFGFFYAGSSSTAATFNVSGGAGGAGGDGGITDGGAGGTGGAGQVVIRKLYSY